MLDFILLFIGIMISKLQVCYLVICLIQIHKLSMFFIALMKWFENWIKLIVISTLFSVASICNHITINNSNILKWKVYKFLSSMNKCNPYKNVLKDV